MGLASKLKDLAVKLEQKNNSLFDYPIEKQKQFLAHFNNPKDDIERGYFQYRCQMKFNHPMVSLALNLVSLPMILLYFMKKGDPIEEISGNSSVFFADGKPENIIPEELRKQAGKIVVVNDKKERLTKKDKAFWIRLVKRYPFSWQFLLKCLMKIRYYGYEILKESPKNIIVCNEYSFTCSVMTAYCEAQEIRHINVMHGEKLFYMRDSFFRFHECYVWDDFYKCLFCKLRAEETQFHIALPASLKFMSERKTSYEKDYTYYLGAEKGEKLKIIVEAMERLRKNGKRVAIRPHPRYSDQEEIQRIAPNIELENVNNLTIEASLCRTNNAVSVYSTVLNQAYSNGINIVIDDISDPVKYEKLEERLYIMLEKEHRLLSKLLIEF